MAARNVEAAYALAREVYASYGVDTDAAVAKLATVPISLHCWQGDDVGGFENVRRRHSAAASPPRATTPARRARPTNCAPTSTKALSLIPGTHRFNLHAIYGEIGGQAGGPRRAAARALRRLDRLGEVARASAWTSTRPSSRTRRPPTASPCRTATRASATSGSTHGIACRHDRRGHRPARSARPASPTSGFRTA